MRACTTPSPHPTVAGSMRTRPRQRQALAAVIVAAVAMLASLLTFPAPAQAAKKSQYSGPIFAIGDSVMMGARSCLESRRYSVDAVQLPNNYSRYTFEERTNAAIRELPQRHRNVRVFDWNAITNNRPHLFWSDGFHVNPKGCAAYAKRLDTIARS